MSPSRLSEPVPVRLPSSDQDAIVVTKLSAVVPLPEPFSAYLVVEIVQADGKKNWRTASVQCSVDEEEDGIADVTWKEHLEWQCDADELTFLRLVVTSYFLLPLDLCK